MKSIEKLGRDKEIQVDSVGETERDKKIERLRARYSDSDRDRDINREVER